MDDFNFTDLDPEDFDDAEVPDIEDEQVGAVGPEEPAPAHSNFVTNIDGFDREIWDDIAPRNTKVQSLLEAHPGEQVFEDLMTDAFGCFYKYKPRILDETSPARELNKTMIQQIMDLPEYQQLRNYSKGDEYIAAASLESVKRVFDSVPPEAKQAQEHAEDAQRQMDQTLNDPAADPSTEQGRKMIQKAIGKAKTAGQQCADAAAKATDKIRALARKAITQAAQEAADEQEAGNALGWGSGVTGSMARIPAQKRLRLAAVLATKSRLRKLAEMAGRFIRIAEKKQAEKVNYDRQIIEGIEQGDSVPDIVPEEFAKLRHPKTRLLFYKGFVERSLHQYQLSSREPKGKGPICACVDCSGSMGIDNHAPITWAMAVALALYRIARLQKREFSIILFTSIVIKNQIWLKHEVGISPGDFDSIFGINPGGGTNFENALNQFIKMLDYADGKQIISKDSDLVFITDGECDVSPTFVENWKTQKAARGFNVYSVLIGNRARDNAVLAKFSDKVFSLKGTANFEKNQGAVFDSAFTI